VQYTYGDIINPPTNSAGTVLITPILTGKEPETHTSERRCPWSPGG